MATNETHSIREFLDVAFGYVNLDWQQFVEFDPRYLRPAEVDLLIGDAGRAKEKLGWEPSVTFEELVKIMVDADLRAIGLEPPGEGEALMHREAATVRQDSPITVDLGG